MKRRKRQTPERRAKAGEKSKLRWRDPEYKARVSKKISDAKKRAWKDD
jgi:hypothetical protein